MFHVVCRLVVAFRECAGYHFQVWGINIAAQCHGVVGERYYCPMGVEVEVATASVDGFGGSVYAVARGAPREVVVAAPFHYFLVAASLHHVTRAVGIECDASAFVPRVVGYAVDALILAFQNPGANEFGFGSGDHFGLYRSARRSCFNRFYC